MPSVQPTPQTWTLRLKSNRTTVLLHVDKAQTFSSIRDELLHALHETNPDGHLHGLPIPSTSDHILLARPIDASDLEAGWESLDAALERDAANDETSVNGSATNGKGKKSKSNGFAGGFRDCPLGAGLKDGGVLAFKFRSESAAGDGAAVSRDGEHEDEGVGMEEKWDVVLAKYDDVYDLLNAPTEEELNGLPEI